MADRTYDQAPALAPNIRTQMIEGLYGNLYARSLPREDFDRQIAGKSDLDLANATYDAFYKDKIGRPDFNQQVGLTSASGSTQRAIMNGASFGFMDEIGSYVGAIPGALIEGRNYGEERDRILGAQRQNATVFRQNNPYLGAGLEAAGGLVSGGVAGAASAPATVPAQVGRAVATGAASGALTGFGEGEGGLQNRIEGAAVGGALGAGFGALLPVAMRLGGGVIGRAGRAMGVGDSDEVANNLLLRSLKDDGLTPRQALDRLTAWQRDGAKPETLFDIAGENTRRLARTAAGRTGPGTDQAVTFLAERQADQGGRIADDAARGLGQSADDFHTRLQGLQTQRAATAAPLYDRAWNQRVPHTVQDQLAPFVSDRIGQDALNKGMRVLELEHLADPRLRNRPFDPEEFGVVRGEDGGFVLQGRMQNMRLLDAVKRGFDEIVEGFRDPTSGRLALNQYGRAVNDVRAQYVEALRDRFPTYAKALDAWGGPSQSMDAMNRGRNIFTMRDAEVPRAIQGGLRNPSDAEFFRLGVAQAIQDRISRGADGADAYKAIFGSPSKRALLRSSFPDQAAFDAFEASMKREAAMYRNAQFVSPRTGSQTAMREADAGDIGETAVNAGLAAMGLGTSSPRGVVNQFLVNQAARARGLTPQVADAASRRLFNSDPAAIANSLAGLEGTQSRNALAYTVARRREEELARRLATGAVAGRD